MIIRVTFIILFIISLPFQTFAKNIEDYSNNFKVEIPNQYLITPQTADSPFLLLGIDNLSLKGKTSLVTIFAGNILEECITEDTFNSFSASDMNGFVNTKIKRLKDKNLLIKTVTASNINNRMYILSTYKDPTVNAFCFEADFLLNKRIYTIGFMTNDEETYNIKAPEYIQIVRSFNPLY
jgi:hypothetical protein